MPIRQNDAPLIVTAVLDTAAFAILDDLRRRYFPAALNKVPAHISLFHHLPGDQEHQIRRDIENVTRDRPAPHLQALGPKSLGRGVAIDYEGRDLEVARTELARTWSGWLTAQDRQKFRPHVTIQNKVSPEQAHSLFQNLQGVSFPDCRVEALGLWRYLGGPWEAIAECRFGSVSPQ